MARTFSGLLMICLLILSCGKQEVSEIEVITETPPPNILFVIADDMGKDATPNYSEGQEKPQMPTLEMLANSGITFDNVWAYPRRKNILAFSLVRKWVAIWVNVFV